MMSPRSSLSISESEVHLASGLPAGRWLPVVCATIAGPPDQEKRAQRSSATAAPAAILCILLIRVIGLLPLRNASNPPNALIYGESSAPQGFAGFFRGAVR